MNSVVFIISCVSVVVLGLVSVAHSQVREPGVTDADYTIIQQALDQRLNKGLKVIGVVNFDSARTAESWIFEKPVRDPYKTLKGCYLFFASNRFGSAESEVEDRIGILKNEEILWFSDPLNTSTNFGGGNLKGALDLNKDGIVEFWVSLYHGMQGQRESWLIYEWDGNRAELISNLDEDDQSVIKMRRGSSELIDIEPDEVLEIKGKWFDGKPKLYSWNGQKYGDWGMSLPSQLPRNVVEVEVGTKIKQAEEPTNLLTFQYNISNRAGSLQSIEELAVKNFSIAPKNANQPNNWRFNPHVKYRLVSWQVKNFLEQHPEALLEPGESDSSFSFTTTGLPRPAKYFVKGNNGDLSFDIDDLVNNSVSEITLGPYNPPENASTFTDSLSSYTTRACELQWITNKGICNSLESKLKNVSQHLDKEKPQKAGNVLGAFLNEVEAQKGKHLTSEGYGLLYFNAVYLREKLTEKN